MPVLAAGGANGSNPPANAPSGRHDDGATLQGGQVPNPAPGSRQKPNSPNAPILPEAPFAVILPLIGIAAAAGTLAFVSSRRRARITTIE